MVTFWDGVMAALFALAFALYSIAGEWDTVMWILIAAMWFSLAVMERKNKW